MPMSLELIFIMKPQDLHVLLGEIRQCIYILCDSLLTNQISFNIKYLLQYQTKISDSLAQDCFYFQGIFGYTNERDTLTPDCKQKHMLENGAPTGKCVVLYTVCYIWNSMVLTAGSMFGVITL